MRRQWRREVTLAADELAVARVWLCLAVLDLEFISPHRGLAVVHAAPVFARRRGWRRQRRRWGRLCRTRRGDARQEDCDEPANKKRVGRWDRV